MESIDSLVIEYTLLTNRSSRAVQGRFLLILLINEMSPKKGTLTCVRKELKISKIMQNVND